MSNKDDVANFNMRDFRKSTQAMVKLRAGRAGVTLAEWMDRAAHLLARVEDGDTVLPPGEPQPMRAASYAEHTDRIRALAELVQARASANRAPGGDLVAALVNSTHAQLAELEHVRGPREPRQRKLAAPEQLRVEGGGG